MNSSKLDRRVTIEAVSVSLNGSGEPIETWSTVAEIAAGRATTAATERFTKDQRYSTLDQVWEIRWYPFCATLNPKTNRLVYLDRVYNLLGVEEIGRKEGAFLISAARADMGGGN